MADNSPNLLQYSSDPAPREISGKLAVGFTIATIPLAAGVFWTDYDKRPWFFLSAIVCALMALFSAMWSARPKRSNRTPEAWIAIALLELACLFAIALSSGALVRTRDGESTRVMCASNMRQILLAILMYTNEQPDGHFPPSLDVLLTTEDIDNRVFVCPESSLSPAPGATAADQAASMRADPAHYLSYAYFGRGLTNDPNLPPQAILFEPLSDHGGDGANVGYSDGSVTWLDRKQAVAAFKAALSAAATRPTTLPSTQSNDRGEQR